MKGTNKSGVDCIVHCAAEQSYIHKQNFATFAL